MGEYFSYLKDLNEDLYKRYLMIEESLKNTSGNVYVDLQAYLEHLLKFIDKREGYNITSKTLGEYLKHNKIIHFCLVRLEYDNLEILKTINSQGNHYKHQKIVNFDFNEFIKYIKELEIITQKVFSYYKKNKVHQLSQIDTKYYENIILEERNKIERHEEYRENITTLSETLTDKYHEITNLKQDLQDSLEKNKKINKENDALKKELELYKKEVKELNEKMNQYKENNKHLEKELKELRQVNKELDKELKTLHNLRYVSQSIIQTIIEQRTNNPFVDMNIVNHIKNRKN